MSPIPTTTSMATSENFAVYRRWLVPLFVFIAIAIPCAIFYRDATTPFFSVQAPANVKTSEPVELDTEETRLDRVLKAAAMEDNTVILAPLNSAWASPGSIIDLFLGSFHIGNGTQELLEHLVIVCLDQLAYNRCKAIHTHCFALVTEGVDFSGEKGFMSEGYLAMVWRKIDFLRMVLEKGYNFIFSDGDIVWLRNPIPHFYPDSDFQVSCDSMQGNETDLKNWPNTGFKYVKANNKTIALYKYWYDSRLKYPKEHDQNALNLIKRDPYLDEIGVKIKFFSTDLFGGLCSPSKDFTKVCTMHSNCCVGLGTKIRMLRVILDDWLKYLTMPPSPDRDHYSWSFRKDKH